MAAPTAELSRRIFEDVWNRKNLNAIDDLISTDYVHTTPVRSLPAESTATNNSLSPI